MAPLEKSDAEKNALIVRKSYLVEILTAVYDKIKTVTLSIADAEVQLRFANRQETIFEKIFEDIVNFNATLPEKKDQISLRDVETIRELIQAIVKKCIDSKLKHEAILHAQSAKPEVSGDRFHESTGVKSNSTLPKLVLPSWDGSVAKWTEFKVQFDSIIHNRTDITDVVKLQYLRSCLSDEPLAIVNQHELSNESYKLAYDELVARYQNKRRLAAYHLHKILSFKSQSITSAKEHVKFIEIHRGASSAIKNLGIEDLADFVLFELSYQNLSVKFQKEFDKENTDLPTMEKLLSYVEKLAKSDELRMDKGTTVVQPPIKKPGASQPPIIKDRFRGNYNKSIFFAKKSSQKCYLCKMDSHLLFNCPKLLSLPVSERKIKVLEIECCPACLYSHPERPCTSKHACKLCGSKQHNTILHCNEPTTNTNNITALATQQPSTSTPSAPAAGPSNSAICNSCTSVPTISAAPVLLATFKCYVTDTWGESILIRGILDPGSQISILSSALSNRLGFRKGSSGTIQGISQSSTRTLGSMNFTIRSVHSSFSYHVSAVILPKICDQIPHTTLPKEICVRFHQLELADNKFYVPGQVHLLLGADVYADLLSTEIPTIIPGNPTAIRTKLGFVLMGKAIENQDPSTTGVSLLVSATPLEKAISKFWEIEEISTEPISDPADVLCEKHFVDTHTRDEHGRFIVRLPFLPDVSPLGSNQSAALKSLSALKRRFLKNPSLAESYEKCLSEYISLEHMSLCEPDQTISYLLPHHAVVKEGKSTACRVVFNCSSPDHLGLSLNDRLYRGPPLLNDIPILLTNFRFFPVAVSADIKMMYRMVLINEADRNCLIIAWFSKENPDQLLFYRMNRLTFGMKPAGYLAGRCIVELANKHKHEYPLAAQAIMRNRYSDDFCSGAEDLDTAIKLRRELTELLSKGGFEIRRWSSNVSKVLEEVPENCKETLITLPSGEIGVKILGIMWDHSTDSFVVTVKPFETTSVTKRSVLSFIAKLFDIMGFFCPVVFQAKYFMQRLWLLKLGWDEVLPDAFVQEWKIFTTDLLSLSNAKIPRHIPINSEILRLIGFSDASEKGMCAIIYLYNDNEKMAYFLRAKTKLAPLKTLTMPRLELCASLLLAQLVQNMVLSSDLSFQSIDLFVDSNIVLAWLETPPHELKIFVSNRVTQIKELTPSAYWNHVSGMDNPADIGSRGCSADSLLQSNLWWNGPMFLQSNYNQWPTKAQEYFDLTELPERKPSQVNIATVAEEIPKDWFLIKYSSFPKLIRHISFIKRFVHNASSKRTKLPRIKGPITVQELEEATITAIRMTQARYFPQELEYLRKIEIKRKKLCPNVTQPYHYPQEIKDLMKKKFKNKAFLSLSPFYDDKLKIIRVGGRLNKMLHIPEVTRHPYLLNKKSHLSSLICNYYHELSLHSGAKTSCALVQKKFWILSLTSLMKMRILQCSVCHYLCAKPKQPIMADILPDRLQFTHCWAKCALDFGGPFQVRESNLRKSTLHKSYICVFVCLTTKAIHLEMVTDLSTPAFLAAFSRFCGRRSVPDTIYSDNGSNFVGARNVLRECCEFLIENHNKLHSAAASVGSKWVLNPPYAPNFNGCAENGIKSAKALIKRQVGNQVLTFEEFATLLCRVEQVLNSRPIEFCTDINDQDTLFITPGHFITGREMMMPPEVSMDDEKTSYYNRWKNVQQTSQVFWKKWSAAYINELMPKKKWREPVENLRVGDVVYIKGIETTPLSWPLGRIVEVYPSKDGTVRVARVKSRGRFYVRPVNKLIALPIKKE